MGETRDLSMKDRGHCSLFHDLLATAAPNTGWAWSLEKWLTTIQKALVPGGRNDHDARHGHLLGSVQQSLQDGQHERGRFTAAGRSARAHISVFSQHN